MDRGNVAERAGWTKRTRALGSGLLFFAGTHRVKVTVIRPDAVIVEPPGSGGDPNVVYVRFRWTADGYCSGQFSVQASEDAAIWHIFDDCDIGVQPVTYLVNEAASLWTRVR